MARFFCASLVIVGVLLAAGPASAQFGSIFGNPPRPPSSVPTQRYPTQSYPPQSYPPAQTYPPAQAYPPAQQRDDAEYERLPPPPQSGYPQSGYPNPSNSRPTYPSSAYPGSPPQGTLAPAARQAPSTFESQPLPPPPGGTAEPARPPAPSQPAAALPPGTTAPPPPGAAATAPAGAPPPVPEEAVTVVPTQKVPNPTAIFSGLDKITGRITTFEVGMNETVQFGALRVRPRACYTRLPTEAPNTTGFVEVDEVTLQGEVKGLFRGWMFASSPGLHAVEHPIYDVWLTGCKGAQTAAAEEPDSAALAPAPAQGQRRQSASQGRSPGSAAVPAQRVPIPRRSPR
jgi:hypothetical protein